MTNESITFAALLVGVIGLVSPIVGSYLTGRQVKLAFAQLQFSANTDDRENEKFIRDRIDREYSSKILSLTAEIEELKRKCTYLSEQNNEHRENANTFRELAEEYRKELQQSKLKVQAQEYQIQRLSKGQTS